MSFEEKYHRYVKSVSYNDWEEYHHYLTWLYYCRIFKINSGDLDHYYNWISHGSFHPRFIKALEEHELIYQPGWDLNSEPWKSYVSAHPDESESSIRHYLWIHTRSREYNREAFHRWRETVPNREDMRRWKDWILWKDSETDNHRKHLKKKHPKCGCIYCGSKGQCSCRGWEDEVDRQRRWEKLRKKLLR